MKKIRIKNPKALMTWYICRMKNMMIILESFYQTLKLIEDTNLTTISKGLCQQTLEDFLH